MTEFSDRFWSSGDGLKLHYRDYPGRDDRPPIICLPGLTRNARDFEVLARRLAGEWRVICPEMRGRGDSAYDRFLGDYTHGPNDTLGTVEEGPFYAVQIVPGDVGTYGGVVTDANARVLMPGGKAIEGLYATGTTTAGVMGRAYPGAGCSIGPSFTWGFVAAKHAAGLGNSGV